MEPHKLEINKIKYLFFNECENIYINILEKFIPFNRLETYIKKHILFFFEKISHWLIQYNRYSI